MRTRITLIICLCLFAVGRASAQWAVIDPVSYTHLDVYKRQVYRYTAGSSLGFLPDLLFLFSFILLWI